MSERPKRREPPLAVKLAAALRQLAEYMGCDPKELDFDHNPALGLRPVNDAGTDYEPRQHDPNHLYWLHRPKHSLKTNGRRGESYLSLDSNSDKARIAKAKRIEAVRKALLESPPPNTEEMIAKGYLLRRAPDKPKSQWPQGRKIQSRNTLRKK